MTRQHPLRGRIPAMRGPCSALRVATIRYGDYVEQLTYLLFGCGITLRFARYEPAPQQAGIPACCLRMADERSRQPYNQASPVLAGYDWPSLVKKDGDELFDHNVRRGQLRFFSRNNRG